MKTETTPVLEPPITLHLLRHFRPGVEKFFRLEDAAYVASRHVEQNTAYPVKITEGETLIWQNKDDGGEHIREYYERNFKSPAQP